MKNSLKAIVAFTVAGLATVVPACGSRDRAFDPAPERTFPPIADAAAEAAACGQIRCSPDLKKVLRQNCDGRDEMVEECGPDQGCGGVSCVDACQAAELSKGSMGCNFFTLPPEDRYSSGDCFAAFIANTWDRPVDIRSEFDGKPLDLSASTYLASKVGDDTQYTQLSGPLPQGAVAVVFLLGVTTADVACPKGVVPALGGFPIEYKTALTRAVRLTTNAPVSAYSIYPYGGASSHRPTATLLFPTSAWSTNYMAVVPERVDTADEEAIQWGSDDEPEYVVTTSVYPRTLQIIASEDDTEVRMRPTTDISDGKGIKGIGKGYVQKWTLKRGEVLQFAQQGSLTGSPIEATKPIGVFGGAECSFVPSTWWACDAMQQQIPPLSQWGSSYALVPYRPRTNDPAPVPVVRERFPWTVVAAASGTILHYDPAPPPGAPETLNAGEHATFFTRDVVALRTQDAEHPVFVGSYMTGQDFDGGEKASWPLGGDPDFVNVVPSDQFLDRYVFFADYTYANTTLTIVRRKTNGAFAPVTLDCVGELTDFHPVGTTGQYEFTWVRLTSAFGPGTGTCGYGRHEAKSGGPFSLTVWGTDSYASYGYAGGTGLRPLTELKSPIN